MSVCASAMQFPEANELRTKKWPKNNGGIRHREAYDKGRE